MSLSVVKTINGVKQLVPLSGATPVDIVQDGNMNPVTSNAVFNKFGKMQAVTGDANDLTTVGFYTGYSLTNAPVIGWVNYIVTCYDNSPLFVIQIAITSDGMYLRESGVGGWRSWQNITKPQVVSRTICAPLGVSALFNNDGIDCLTDCKYADGMHHVSGLISFNPSRDSNGFQISATPSRIVGVGNLMWVNGNTGLGTTVTCRVSNNHVLWWTGDQITINDVIVNFDFWYKEA